MERNETGYEMQELVPIVARLSRKMTGMESSSVTYEKAEQLMKAVLYCIREWEKAQEDRGCAAGQTRPEVRQLPAGEKLPAARAYELGVQCVTEKVKQTLKLYHEILENFDSYGNRCLYDTIVKGIPEFFKWYDVKFCPQDTILTLDYPIGRDLRNYEGVDAVWEYLQCIQEEQRFLAGMDRNRVLEILRDYCMDCEEMIENLRQIVERA